MLKILFAIPKTLWFNLRYLPLKQAINLPIWIAWNCKINLLGGGNLQNPKICFDKDWLSRSADNGAEMQYRAESG